MKKNLDLDSVRFVVIHATRTSPRSTVTLEDVKEKRLKGGFLDIGYHFLITRAGGLQVGVPLPQVGTHTARFSDEAIGVLIEGGKTARGRPADNYTDKQKKELKELIADLLVNSPNAEVIGVGELLGGTSPHFNIKELLCQ